MRGIGTAGGFKMMVQDKRGRGIAALEAATQDLVAAANRTPGLAGVFSLFNTRHARRSTPISTGCKAEMLGVSADKVFEALEVYLGSAFVNEFNYLGRTYQVIAQADAPFRRDIRDIANLKTRNDSGARWCRSARSPPSATSPGPTACRATISIRPREVQGNVAARLFDRLRHRGDGAARGRAPARRLRL